MDFYTILREFADSWFLLLMTLFFVGAILWALRPGASRLYRDTADIPFRHDDKPAVADSTTKAPAKKVTT